VRRWTVGKQSNKRLNSSRGYPFGGGTKSMRKKSTAYRKERGSMQLVEQHVISKRDPRYAIIDAAAFKSKNLYNAALYLVRQSFIHEGKYLNYHEVQKRMQSHEAYKALPAKVS
jgi:hypothetical protein